MSNRDWGSPDRRWVEPNANWQAPHGPDASQPAGATGDKTESVPLPPKAPPTGEYQPLQTPADYQTQQSTGDYQAPQTGSFQAPPTYSYHSPRQAATNGYQTPYSSYNQQAYSPNYQTNGGSYNSGGPVYASFGKRVIGWLFDYFLPLTAINIFAAIPLFLVEDEDLGGLLSYVIQILLYMAWFFFLSYTSGETGKTPGRKIAKTKLVYVHTGQPIGVRKTFVRYVCHFADGAFCAIGWLFPLWTTERQTIADMVVKTVVVEDVQY